MQRGLSRRFFSGLILFNLLLSGSVLGQKRRSAPVANTGTPTASAKSEKKPVCNGGWTGVVTITKTLQDSHHSDEPGIRKAKDRIIHDTSRDYRYVGRALVESPDPHSPKVIAKVNFTDTEKLHGLEKVWDTCNSRESGHWFTIESTDDRKTTAQMTGSAKSFNLTVDEATGRYNLNLQLPDAQGQYKREEKLRRAGHCQPKNNEPWDRSTDNVTKVDGESLSVYNEKIDPRNPNEISGSKVWGYDGTGRIKTFVFKAEWRFTRCPSELLVTSLKFGHPKYPNLTDWQEIVDQTGTVDGNLVKIKATVWNKSAGTKFVEVMFKESYQGDQYNASMRELPLKNDSVSIRLEAGEEREVEVEWDTSGFAWFDDGRPRTIQRIKAEAWESYKKKDELIRNLKIAPRPLVVIGGLWSDANTFSAYQNYLTTAHSYDWKALIFNDNVTGSGAKPGGHPRSVYDYADALETKVRQAQIERNAWHIDVAGHSTGGLIGRLFVHKFGTSPDGEARVKHLMLMGTPNAGVACTGSLESEFSGFPEKLFSAKELLLEEMQRFNKFVTERHGTTFSALVGRSGSMLCAPLTAGDGVVDAESASAGVQDVASVSDKHANLADPKYFGEFIRPQVVTGPRGTYPLKTNR